MTIKRVLLSIAAPIALLRRWTRPPDPPRPSSDGAPVGPADAASSKAASALGVLRCALDPAGAYPSLVHLRAVKRYIEIVLTTPL